MIATCAKLAFLLPLGQVVGAGTLGPRRVADLVYHMRCA